MTTQTKAKGKTNRRKSLPGVEKKVTKTKGKRQANRVGRPSVAAQWGLPIREAKRDLPIPLLNVDEEEAMKFRTENPNDEQNFLSCILACAVTRVAGVARVAILRQLAYVVFPGDKHVNRYIISPKARKVLEAWDRGEEVEADVELVLQAPTKKQSAEARRRAVAEWNKKNSGRRNGHRKTERKNPQGPAHEDIVRHGNLVRFS